MERRILARLIKTGKPAAAVRAIDERLRRLWVSALQSRMFNQVRRPAHGSSSFDQLMTGDLAWKHDNGACFLVETPRPSSPAPTPSRSAPPAPSSATA